MVKKKLIKKKFLKIYMFSYGTYKCMCTVFIDVLPRSTYVHE